MEDIKTSFDKIMESLNDSVTHSAPKQILFDYTGQSSTKQSSRISKKRRLLGVFNTSAISDDEDSTVPNETAESEDASAVEPKASTPISWTEMTLKADLLHAKSRIAFFQKENERLLGVQNEMQTLHDSKLAQHADRQKHATNKILEMEKHLQVVRQREQATKKELIKMQHDSQQKKLQFEERLMQAQRSLATAEDQARQTEFTLKTELSENRRHAEKLEMELQLVTEELGKVKAQLSECRERVIGYDKMMGKYETDRLDLESAKSRIKELEFEIASYNDWKNVLKNTPSNLLKIPEMEREIERLKASNSNWEVLMSDKILLEEKYHDVRARLAAEEANKVEAVALQVKLTHVEKELHDWIKLGQDHCPPNTLACPVALRAQIENLLQGDVINASERAQKETEVKILEDKLQELKDKGDLSAKTIEELSTALRRHKTFKDRIHKKLLMVTKERDCYKNLLETFEKDFNNTTTITSTESTMNAEVTQLRARIDMLEKVLTGYKTMCATLEKEVDSAKSSTETSSESVAFSGDACHERMRKELDSLRLENEHLRRRKEELELRVENRLLRQHKNGDEQLKVVHLSQNPAATAYEQSKDLIEKLQAQIERLKVRNQQLLQDNEQTQARLNETTNLTVNIKEANQLRAELESTTAKMKKMKDCYKKASMEFRDVCYMLFGYRIDHVGMTTNYTLSSMYAESPDDYLNFRLNDSNMLDMLETPFSLTLKPLMETQLERNKSLPAFLSALTLELFQRSTVTIS